MSLGLKTDDDDDDDDDEKGEDDDDDRVLVCFGGGNDLQSTDFIARAGIRAECLKGKNRIKKNKKSGKYWGPRRNGWAGAVSDGQGQFRLFHY